MYSAQLLDHFQNPRNTGDVGAPDASAEVENPACGDILRLSLRVNDGRIIEARFKAKGCVPAIACGSALTELVLGQTPVQAGRLRREDVIHAVGEVPPASTHAAQLAIDVLFAVLAELKAKQPKTKDSQL